DENQDVEQISLVCHKREKQDQEGQDKEFHDFRVKVSHSLYPFSLCLAEKPLGPDEQDEQEYYEGYGILVSGRDQPGSEGFKYPQEKPAQNRAYAGGEAADDGCAKALKPEHYPHIVGGHGERGDYDAGQRPQRSADGKGEEDHLPDVDSHQAGSPL